VSTVSNQNHSMWVLVSVKGKGAFTFSCCVAFCPVRIFEQNKINISGLDVSSTLTLPRLRHFLPRDSGVIMVSYLKCCLLTHRRHSFAGM